MRIVPPALPPRPAGRVVVLGAGKASARMAEAVEAQWGPCEGGAPREGGAPCEGLVITRRGHGRPLAGIDLVEAAHPVPDAAGMAATRRMLAVARGLGADDLALVLISGGASALLSAPRAPLAPEDKVAVHRALLASGLPIAAMNAVRRALSAVKGGRLAAACHPARVLTLAISDVPGDDPALIGSGPAQGGRAAPGALNEALVALGNALPPAARDLLAAGDGALAEDDPRIARAETRVIAAPSASVAAAADVARRAGLRVRDLGEIEGEAREVGRAHAVLALRMRAEGAGPAVLLSGGELTVTATPGADGVGGPNAEYALAAALTLRGAPGIWAMAGDTDGVDGAAEIAGAIAGPGTARRAVAAGASLEGALARHDAHGLFAATGDGLVTGPTLTNVNDLRAILVL